MLKKFSTILSLSAFISVCQILPTIQSSIAAEKVKSNETIKKETKMVKKMSEDKNIKVFTEKQTDIVIENGKSFIIKLDSNPTTGYSWSLTKEDKTLLKSYPSEYKKTEMKTKGVPMAGVGGTELWKFSALKKGQTEVKLDYLRPWEKNVAPIKEFTFKIKII